MQTVTLGRSKLVATVAGLGTGGYSRIGFFQYGPEHAASIVRTAFDAGVNFFDSSAVYRTESAIGAGLHGIARDKYILSTKFLCRERGKGMKTEADFMESLEKSLRALRTDYVDIFHLHAVYPEDYARVCEIFVPALQKARQQGKIRFPGVTEIFNDDTTHDMLQMALEDDFFDVVMVGYNLLNPSAAQTVFPLAMEKNIGTLCMFAVRNALSHPDSLKQMIQEILAHGQADAGILRPDEDLSFLAREGGATSIVQAAYRFCRHTPGVDVVLTGTGNAEHLKENLASIKMPPLPEATLQKLAALFGSVTCVSGE